MSKLLTGQCVCLHGGALPNRNLGTRARALGAVDQALTALGVGAPSVGASPALGVGGGVHPPGSVLRWAMRGCLSGPLDRAPAEPFPRGCSESLSVAGLSVPSGPPPPPSRRLPADSR